MEALRAWAERQLAHDLIETATDGWPRKILVFTSFVGGAARDLRETMQKVMDSAWKQVCDHAAWKGLARKAAHGLLLVTRNIEKFINRDKALSFSTAAGESSLPAWARLAHYAPLLSRGIFTEVCAVERKHRK